MPRSTYGIRLYVRFVSSPKAKSFNIKSCTVNANCVNWLGCETLSGSPACLLSTGFETLAGSPAFLLSTGFETLGGSPAYLLNTGFETLDSFSAYLLSVEFEIWAALELAF